jgi:hypothetical protein
VSTPPESWSPVEPAGPRHSSTQEIPVMQPAGATAASQQLPPHPDAAAPSRVSMSAPQPTGPVDFVPGLPGIGTPPVPPAAAVTPPPPLPAPAQAAPAAGNAAPTAVWPDTLESEVIEERPVKNRRARAPRDRAALLGLGLAVASLGLLELGLALRFDAESLWTVVPLWSAFATLCAAVGVLALAASFAPGDRLRSGAVRRVAAAGLVGLAVFWLLVVLPFVDSDRGFLLTAALAALGGALWTGAGRNAA